MDVGLKRWVNKKLELTEKLSNLDVSYIFQFFLGSINSEGTLDPNDEKDLFFAKVKFAIRKAAISHFIFVI